MGGGGRSHCLPGPGSQGDVDCEEGGGQGGSFLVPRHHIETVQPPRLQPVHLHHGLVGVDLPLTLEHLVGRLVVRHLSVENFVVLSLTCLARPPLE